MTRLVKCTRILTLLPICLSNKTKCATAPFVGSASHFRDHLEFGLSVLYRELLPISHDNLAHKASLLFAKVPRYRLKI